MWNNLKEFAREQTKNIIATMIGGLLPIMINWIWLYLSKSGLSWAITERQNYLFQSFFVLASLYVLIRIRKSIMKDLENSKEQIKQYIKKNCGLKIYDDNKTIESAFKTVYWTVSQFFYAWLAVWLMWLMYYVGELVLWNCLGNLGNSYNVYIMNIYQHVFDFLNSTAMFAIFIILTSVTVNYRERTKNREDNTFWESILIWTILFIIFMAGIIIEDYSPWSPYAQIMPFYISLVSTITFVIVLGKLNSFYLRIPSLFLFILYVYAITQAYIPFQKLGVENNEWLKTFLGYAIPYITLLGKIVLMLTISWISVQRRFLFYVIHRSTTIDKADELLSELNKDNVSF